MISSAQPRKQRLFRFTAPMHDRQKFVHAHISKELAAKLGIKKRNIGVRKGDIVKIMNGKNRGKSGKVTNVDLKRAAVLVEGIFRKNAKGKELQIAISASNVYITELDLTDKLRSAVIEAAKVKK
jgi:large subunit ribosomal protein L24